MTQNKKQIVPHSNFVAVLDCYVYERGWAEPRNGAETLFSGQFVYLKS